MLPSLPSKLISHYSAALHGASSSDLSRRHQWACRYYLTPAGSPATLLGVSAAHEVSQTRCAAVPGMLQSSQQAHLGRRLRVCSFTPRMRTLPDLLVLPPQGPPFVKTHLQEQSTVKRHFTELVSQHQPAHPCPVIWASFMFPSGALETEVPSTRNFSNKDIGMVIQLRLDRCISFFTAGEICSGKGCHRCETCPPSHLE